MVFFAVLFVGMIAYLIYFQVAKSEEVANNSYNSRLEDAEEDVTRGTIYSSDLQKLAYTETDEDGNETRVYPFGNVFAQVVGYTKHGKAGIEKLCDYYLLSTSSGIFEQLAHEFYGTKDVGGNVITTLNTSLQQAAYDALGDDDGAVVIIEPDTGKILAMVSKPDYDPNEINDIWDDIVSDDDNTSLLNRATQGLYTPGSIFKIFTTIAYVRQSDDYESFSFYCDGSETFSSGTINCFNKTSHGTEDLKASFAYSCNGAFATIGTLLDIDGYIDTCEDLLFNSELPIDLDYSKSKFNLTSDSSTFDVTQTAIGQGTTLVTPIHMAMIAAAVANDGVLMKPYLVTEIEDYTGTTMEKYSPEEYERLFDESEAALLQEYMSAVTEYGTAKALGTSSSYSAAGKTGTAQLDDDDNINSWFVGYASDDDGREIAICVVLENVAQGSSSASSAAGEIFDAYFD